MRKFAADPASVGCVDSLDLFASAAADASKNVIVVGIDEVGRGPLAGPVVASAVVLPPDFPVEILADSKKLSEKKRQEAYEIIIQKAVSYGTGWVWPEEIDEINILQATKKAMRQAAEQAPAQVFLIDAVTGLGLKGREVPIVKGDATSYAIAAASIIAKVTRDRQMRELDAMYPQYGFARHKGYGTKEHIEALRAYGPCPQHRRSFIGHFV